MLCYAVFFFCYVMFVFSLLCHVSFLLLSYVVLYVFSFVMLCRVTNSGVMLCYVLLCYLMLCNVTNSAVMLCMFTVNRNMSLKLPLKN